MNIAYIAEFVGTALLVLMGDSVVANVNLARTKGHGSGLIVIAFGWGMGLFVAVLCVAAYSGAHLNPAISIAAAVAGKFEWNLVGGYVVAQMLGGIVGGILVYAFYRPHFADTADPDVKLGVFCCAPQYRNMGWAIFCEIVGTFVLAFAIMSMKAHPAELTHGGVVSTSFKLGPLDALPVGLVVLAIGLCLGGTTGYAINPARDLGPRIAHALLPIPGKRDSDWGYAIVPVIGPIIGAVLAALAYPMMAAAH